jgi:hypothetical protein
MRRKNGEAERIGENPGAVRVAPFSGLPTLVYKELLRFWRVSFQTVAAPILTALLYLLIFGHVLEDHVRVYGQLCTAFLGGADDDVDVQNAFANSSSSLIQSKVTGNIVFAFAAPLVHRVLRRLCATSVCRAHRRPRRSRSPCRSRT